MIALSFGVIVLLALGVNVEALTAEAVTKELNLFLVTV